MEFLTPDKQRKVIEVLVVLNVILLFLGGISLYALSNVAHTNRKLAKEGQQAHDALCSIKGGVQRRVDNAQKLLSDNPKAQTLDADPGPQVFLVSRDLLKTSLARDTESLRAFKDFHCTAKEQVRT